MKFGIDQLSGRRLEGLRRRLSEQPFAVLTHSAATDRHGTPLLTLLGGLELVPRCVFTPEHGLDGVAQAEESVASTQLPDGPPVLSLYGTTKASLTPSTEHFSDCKLALIDLVDIGARYYTYAWTALLFARAAMAEGIHCVVLDRPNPITGDVGHCVGRPQDSDHLSFVGLEPIPIRHGLTLGELLVIHLRQDGHALGPEGGLSVVPVEGWERRRTAEAWQRPFIPPSPNMPSLETALLYPGGCLLEGTNLSEGRGTAFPFRAVGAPFLNGNALAQQVSAARLPGLQVRPFSFRPSFEKHAGETCQGVMLHVTDPLTFRPVETYLEVIRCARSQAPDSFGFLERAYEFETEKAPFELLTGSGHTRKLLEEDAPLAELSAYLCPPGSEWAEKHAEGEHQCYAARYR